MKSIQELSEIRDRMKQAMVIRKGTEQSYDAVAGQGSVRSQVLICGGTGCTSSGSVNIHKALDEELERRGLQDQVKVVQTG